MSDNVIELNGKRYDAISGAYLGKSQEKPVPAARPKGRTIDGVIRHAKPEPSKSKPAASKPVHAAPATPKPKQPVHKPAKAVQPDVQPKQPLTSKHHLTAHKPQHAKTLMRGSVSKPKTNIKTAIKLQAPAAMTVAPTKTIAHKRSVAAVDKQRLERAKQTKKADSVDHFRITSAHTTKHHVPVLPVKAAPVVKQLSAVQHSPNAHQDVLDQALAKAESHKQPPHKAKHHAKKVFNTWTVVIAVVLLASVLVYVNWPRIQMHVAASQAGFNASMPSYSPVGYKLVDGVKRYGGTISLTYRSGASSYTITQQSSGWNSQTLLDNTLALSGPHDTVVQNGQTIYIYDDGSSAAWVNGGVRYDLTGNATLSSDDIAEIATSL